MIGIVVVVVQLGTSVQGVPGYETITGTTPAPASMRRLSYVVFFLTSVFLAVVESGGGNGGESCVTVQGLGNSLYLFLVLYLRDNFLLILLTLEAEIPVSTGCTGAAAPAGVAGA